MQKELQHIVCNRCKDLKDPSEFYSRKTSKGTKYSSSKCKTCISRSNKIYRQTDHHRNQRKSWNLKKYYGLTIDQYIEMLKSQGGRCAMCKSSGSNNKKYKTFVVDHDHSTGKIRGLLCHKCNLLLGHSNDNVETLQKAILYLQNNCSRPK